METKTIKISTSTYKAICRHAGELQHSLGEPVSLDKALALVLRKGKLSDLAGAWKMTDREAEEMMESLHKGWARWRTKSV